MSERMYGELADWWGLISPVADYAEEAEVFRRAILEHAPTSSRTMLELGSGGGHNAFHLKNNFTITLVDRAEGMLRQSRKLNPDLSHHCADMRDVRLGALFDVVFIHDAITYMTTRDDLERAMKTAFFHCRPGGVALFAPDETKERFVAQTSHGGSDDGMRGARYLEWVWDPDPDDETIVTDYTFALRDESGEVRTVYERHVHGVFPRRVWLATMEAVGFEPHSKVYELSDLEDGYELFLGVRRS